MKKKDKVSMSKKEFVKEHKKLVSVLRSPSHKDDLKEAKEQQEELNEVTNKSMDPAANVEPGTGLSGKIARHNMAKLHKFAKDRKKMKKSIDFQQTKTAIDSKDQQLAEQTANPALIQYLKTSISNDITKIPFIKGTLTLAQKEPGLYNGFFSDTSGQVIEKFDSQTIELVAKNMEMKDLFSTPTPADTVTGPEANDLALAAHDRIDMTHNRIDEVERKLAEQPMKGVKSLKVKFGDFELELRKSIKGFITDFKKSRSVDSDFIKKAVQSWRKQHQGVLDIASDQAAARELFSNWEEHRESFNQTVYGLQQLEKDDE